MKASGQVGKRNIDGTIESIHPNSSYSDGNRAARRYIRISWIHGQPEIRTRMPGRQAIGIIFAAQTLHIANGNSVLSVGWSREVQQ